MRIHSIACDQNVELTAGRLTCICEVRYWKPIMDGYTIVSKDGGPNIGSFCSLKALKDFARHSGLMVFKANWAQISLDHKSILGPELASKMGQAFARMNKRSRGEVV